MADSRTIPPPSDRHRHAHRPVPRRRRSALLIAGIVVLVAAIAAVLVLASGDGSDEADAADRAVASPAASTTPVASSESSPPPTAPALSAEEPASAPDVPEEFAASLQQMGIPLDAHTGWVVAQGICVRLGQPEYDQFRMSEGVERLFPSVEDEQAHDFVAMVAESVCPA
ncbi:hypothetical protein [Geodermatophilus sp. URMC 62]|uniref:hypothetical protein n=1 Tax=Geodermatophilus sp. URMC 62 TaxID=3423414 RepID=UPI00406C7D75